MSEEQKPIYSKTVLADKCPKCNSNLKPVLALMTDWPYVHCDVQLDCVSCDFKALYGIPLDKVAGLALQIYDSDPEKVLAVAKQIEKPTCPFHDALMIMTKIFGNKVFKDEHVRVQFKCPICYLTLHKDKTPLLDRHEIECRAAERLKRMGYL